jgi:hypothetical protein
LNFIITHRWGCKAVDWGFCHNRASVLLSNPSLHHKSKKHAKL